MNDGLPSNYDQWKLASPYDDDDKCECGFCQAEVRLDETCEATNGENICERCAEDKPICSCCDKVITEGYNDYGYEDTCDSCIDQKADRLHDSMKGETY